MKCLIVKILSLLVVCNVGNQAAVIRGLIVDAETAQPLPYATVFMLEAKRSTSANPAGRFRLVVPPGRATLHFSHVGYHTLTTEVSVTDSLDIGVAQLQPVPVAVPGFVVTPERYSREELMVKAAIARRRKLAESLRSMSYESYLKEIWRDLGRDSSVNIIHIMESQVTCWWRYPNEYRERIRLRRQPAKIPDAVNDITPGNILMIYRDHLETSGGAVISPLSENALEHYDYYLADSTNLGTRKLYALIVSPKDENSPAMEGRIEITDSTFDLAQLELSANAAARAPGSSVERLEMRAAPLDSNYWLPVLVRSCAEGSVMFPGLPHRIAIEVVASVHDYAIGIDLPRSFFDTRLEIAEGADSFDSAAWNAGQTIPLTSDEAASFARIDSIGVFGGAFSNPVLIGLIAGPILLAGGFPELFHFNRVEGCYSGISLPALHPMRNTRLSLGFGYAWGARVWQWRIALTQSLLPRGRLEFSAEYGRDVRPLGLVNKQLETSTADNLLLKQDPWDYYRQHGWRVRLRSKLSRLFSGALSYTDEHQKSLGASSNFALFNRSRELRPNRPIQDGRLRTITLGLQVDSRKAMILGMHEVPLSMGSYWNGEIQWTVAAPHSFSAGTEFSRLEAVLGRHQQLSATSALRLTVRAGTMTGTPPVQSRFAFANGTDLARDDDEFNTLDDRRLHPWRYGSIFISCHPPAHCLSQGLFSPLGHLFTAPRIEAGTLWIDASSGPTTSADEVGVVKLLHEIGASVRINPLGLLPIEPVLRFARGLQHKSAPSDVVMIGIKFPD